jgi:hypothetical protein
MIMQRFQMLGSGVLATGLLLLSGCSPSAPPAETKVEKKKRPEMPTGPVTGLTAYYEMYKVARQLAPDIQTASLTGNDIDGVKSEEGKYAMWTAVFVSASLKQAATFTYATSDKALVPKGVNSSGTVGWGGPARTAMPFSNSDFAVDSDAAYKTATGKAADWLAKNADKPVTIFALGSEISFPAPMWYIRWGTKNAGYVVYVNASTGSVFGK